MASLMTTYFPVACADTLSKIGLLVKARRLALGLRQADLTAAIGVSAHTLRKIEGGSARVIEMMMGRDIARDPLS